MLELKRRQAGPHSSHLVSAAQPDQVTLPLVHSKNHALAQRHTLSNQATQRFAQSCPSRLPSPSVCPFGGACHTCPARVQTKLASSEPPTTGGPLAVNEPGDRYEQEADRVADHVLNSAARGGIKPMRMPEPRTIQRACSMCGEEEAIQTKPLAEQITPLIQRQVKPEEEEEPLQTKPTAGRPPIEGTQVQRQEEEPEGEEEEEEPVQTKRATGGQALQVGHGLACQIRPIKGGGQPLPRSVRSFFEPRFGYNFSQVRVHTGSQADTAAHAINARAFTLGRDIVFGADQYQPETSGGRHLLAHELVHTMQQRAKTGFAQNAVLQRDLALQPPVTADPARELSPQEVQTAIQFNRRRYNEESIRLIQDVVGVAVTGTMNEETVRAIALIQHQFGLGVDGRVGSDTFDLLVRELTAEGASTNQCLTSFQIVGPGPVGLAASGPSGANMVSQFRVRARFSPRCGCGDFDYRQFICGTVFRVRGTTRTDLKGEFSRLPAGELKPCPDWREDGDTSLPAGVGPHYGHRNEGSAPEDRYLPQRATGCIYEALDRPGLRNYLVQSGDTYEFNIRFFGDIRRRIGSRRQRIERRFWRIRDTVWIP